MRQAPALVTQGATGARQGAGKERDASSYRFPPGRLSPVSGLDARPGFRRSAEVPDDRLLSSLILHTHVRLQFRDLRGYCRGTGMVRLSVVETIRQAKPVPTASSFETRTKMEIAHENPGCLLLLPRRGPAHLALPVRYRGIDAGAGSERWVVRDRLLDRRLRYGLARMADSHRVQYDEGRVNNLGATN